MNESQLIRHIKAHIAQGDKAADKSKQHYTAAGQYLKTKTSELNRRGPGVHHFTKIKGALVEVDENGAPVKVSVWAELEALLRNKAGTRKVDEWDIPISVLAYVAEQLADKKGRSESWKELFESGAISRLDEKTFEWRTAAPGGSEPCVVARTIEYDGYVIRSKGRPRILRFKFEAGRFQLQRSRPRLTIEKPPTKLRLRDDRKSAEKVTPARTAKAASQQ